MAPESKSICLVSTDLDPLTHSSGIGSHCLLLAKLLANAGWQTHLLYCGAVEDRATLETTQQQLGNANIALALLSDFEDPCARYVGRFSEPPRVCLSSRVRYALEELQQRHAFDLIQFVDRGGLGFRSIQAKRAGIAFTDVGLLVRLHGPGQVVRDGNTQWMSHEDLQLDFCERYAFEHACYQIVPGGSLSETVQRLGWNIRADACLVPCVPPEPRSAVTQPCTPAPEIVFFGKLEPRKGLEVFLEAVARLPEHIGVTFLGADDLVERDLLATRQIAARLSGRRVRLLTDSCREQALAYLMERNCLAVLPAVPLAQSMCLLECVANAIPFLAARSAASLELVTDSEARTHLLFEANPRVLLRCLTHYLTTDVEQRERWRKSCAAAFGVAALRRQVVEAYEGILLNHRSKGERVSLTVPTLPQPLVTVAVAYYNLGKYLPDLLESLAKQTYDNLEVVVINDGSTEPESIRVFEVERHKYPQFRFLSQNNAGISPTRNRGLREAWGEYFIPMDADNIALPHMVESFVRSIQRRPDVSALTCCFLAFQETADLADKKYLFACRPLGGPHVLACYDNPYGDLNCIVRTADLRTVGGYECIPEMGGEDLEVYVKLVNAGYRIEVIPDYLFYYRHRADAVSKTTSQTRIYKKILRQLCQAERLPLAERVAVYTMLASLNQQFGCLVNEVEDLRRQHARLWSERYRWQRLLDRLRARSKRVPWLHAILAQGKRASRWGWRGLRQLRVQKFKRLLGDLGRYVRSRVAVADAQVEQAAKVGGDAAFGGEIAMPHFLSTPSSKPGLRLALVCGEFFGSHFGGPAVYSRYLAEALTALGHDVTVVRAGYHKCFIRSRGYRVVDVPVPRIQTTSWPTALWETLRELATERPFDVVEAPLMNGEACTVALSGHWPVVVRLVTPVETVLHSCQLLLDAHAREVIARERLLIERAAGVIAISRAIWQKVEETYQLPLQTTARPTAIFPLGLPSAEQVERRALPFVDAGGPRFLYVGRLEGRKGIVELAEAFRTVGRALPKATLWIVGGDNSFHDGHQGRTGKTYVQALNTLWGPELATRVQFFGGLPDAEKEYLLSQCDVFVAPSRYESFGLILLEAMRYGKPVVSTLTGGIPEVVQDNVTGLLVPVDAVDRLVEAMLAVGSDEQLRRQLGAAGRDRFEQHFRLEHCARRTEEFYHQVMDSWEGVRAFDCNLPAHWLPSPAPQAA